jgi:hypothetical protein
MTLLLSETVFMGSGTILLNPKLPPNCSSYFYIIPYIIPNRLSIHYQSDVDKNNKKPRYTYQGQVGEINVDERLKTLANYKGNKK